MENLNDEPKSYECQCTASSRKRKLHLNFFGSDEESSNGKSKKIQSRNSKPPSDSKAKEDNRTRYSVDSEWENEEREGSHDYNPNHSVSDESQHPAPSPDPWVADFALKRPPYSHSAQEPDPYWRPEKQRAQPLIRSAWAGGFAVYSELELTCVKLEGLTACVSSSACAPARFAVERLQPSIDWEKVPRRSLWPISFERKGGPTDDDIAVFFFPSASKHEREYESLMFDLVREDAALRAWVMDSELLLFTSIELPRLFTRFQGKLFLWGVFRGVQPLL